MKKLLQFRFDMLTEEDYKKYRDEAADIKERQRGARALPREDESRKRIKSITSRTDDRTVMWHGEEKSMAIIAGYRNVGKTHFAEHIDGAIEISALPYRWILPDGATDSSEYRMENPFWPENMVLAVLNATREHKYVVIPAMMTVLKMLRERFGITCVLVYPEANLTDDEDEIRTMRGKGTRRWSFSVREEGLSMIRGTAGVHLSLRLGEYLSDVKAQIDRICEAYPQPVVSPEALDALAAELAPDQDGLALRRYTSQDTDVAWRVSDLDDPETRDFLCHLETVCDALELTTPDLVRISRNEKLKKGWCRWVESKEEFFTEFWMSDYKWDGCKNRAQLLAALHSRAVLYAKADAYLAKLLGTPEEDNHGD